MVHDKCVELLLLAEADVFQRDRVGRTALMRASFNGHHECVDLLIKPKADVNKHETDGNTALMKAAKCSRQESYFRQKLM